MTTVPFLVFTASDEVISAVSRHLISEMAAALLKSGEYGIGDEQRSARILVRAGFGSAEVSALLPDACAEALRQRRAKSPKDNGSRARSFVVEQRA